jgi:asparagine synthase (glutamine-hydrolysing)
LFGVLGHTRLRIIGESKDGRQPYFDRLGNFLVFNGEIYNYKILKARLEELTGEKIGDSDTEVLFNWIKLFGASKLSDLRGMFSFVFYSQEQNSFLLARDRFGIKPLYIYEANGSIAFGSEIQSISSLVGEKFKGNPYVAMEFLTFGAVDESDRSFFHNVRSLPSGKYLSVSQKNGVLQRHEAYWSGNALPESRDLSLADAEKELKVRLLESVNAHLESSVPIAFALSGGLDSTSLVCLARNAHRGRIETFSYVDAGEELSEEKWIEVALNYTNAHSNVVRMDSFFNLEDLDKTLFAQGEPFISPSVIAQNRLFSEVGKNGIRVLIDGQGADELLSGYEGLALARFLDSAFKLKVLSAAVELARWIRVSKSPYRTLVNQALEMARGGLIFKLSRIAGIFLDPRFSLLWKLKFSVWKLRKSDDFGRLRIGRLVNSMSRRRLGLAKLSSLLRYADRNAMAHSVENRVPFLDTDLVDFALSLPTSKLMPVNGMTKSLLRGALKGEVPELILNRVDKIGFEGSFESINNFDSSSEASLMKSPFFGKKFRSKTALPNKFDLSWRPLVLSRWIEYFDIEFAKTG